MLVAVATAAKLEEAPAEAPAADPAPVADPAPAAAVPVQPLPVLILRQTIVNPDPLGAHSSVFESEDGTYIEANGRQSLAGGSVQEGVIRYLLEDGTVAELTYTADEGGYKPVSSLLPVGPPMPAHAIAQIEQARLEAEAAAAAQEADAAAAA
ncbi:cuticle protein AM1274-like [Oratosquilla oratoria]|uniref:cuticle protein AM1274-like n=1 Tax=Oratosquilla oratoria TaxID=337810 RepID=UPI003F769209